MQAGKLDAYSTYLYHQGNNSHSYTLFGARLVNRTASAACVSWCGRPMLKRSAW
jgi:hypothetical protein